MAKEKYSWSKPDGIPGLIGRKQVDWSIFHDGTHIPQEFSEDFLAANRGTNLERGEGRDLTLIIDGKEYAAKFRKRNHTDAFQIRYDSNKELKLLLQERFRQSYEYLQAVRAAADSRRVYVTVPAAHAEYMEFYETGYPFRYRVELVPAKGHK